jgi:L-iditol 2-dehydrogenase
MSFSNRYSNACGAGIAALSGGILNLDALATHKFPLERAVDAMELCSDRKSSSIEIQVVDSDLA